VRAYGGARAGVAVPAGKDLLRSAMRRGITTAVMARSWDHPEHVDRSCSANAVRPRGLDVPATHIAVDAMARAATAGRKNHGTLLTSLMSK
jgi:hypothetical protein